MIFGSISYLNLLPFQLYLKRHLPSSQLHQMLRWKQAVPSILNRHFREGRIDAAFISSIESRQYRCTDLGIVAAKEVRSVLLIPGIASPDPASASSNRLAQILGLQGQILIGDAALKHYLSHKPSLDLAKIWHERTSLPFVFARLCYRRHGKTIQRYAQNFAKKKHKIPQYILKSSARKRGITPSALQEYLSGIHYRLGWKEKRSLRLFLQHVKREKISR